MLTVFRKHIVVGSRAAFLYIRTACLKSLIRERVIKQTSLWNYVLDVKFLAEKFLAWYICLSIQGLEAVCLKFEI